MDAHELYNYIKENLPNQGKCILAIEQEYDIKHLEGAVANKLSKGDRFINVNHRHSITLERKSKEHGEIPEILGGDLPFADKPFANEQKIEEL